MEIKKISLMSGADGNAKILAELNVPPTELSEICRKISQGAKYELTIKPYRRHKTQDQNAAIWAKLGELAFYMFSTKEEIYDLMVRRYSPGVYKRIRKQDLASEMAMYRAVDVKDEREDGSIGILCYKGLSQMNSAEAARLLDGILSELKEYNEYDSQIHSD